MNNNFYTCEECQKEEHEDVGHQYPDEGIFICDTCYGKYLDDDYGMIEDYLSVRDIAAIHQNYPDLDRFAEMQKSDPVHFYLTCKDNPDGLYM